MKIGASLTSRTSDTTPEVGLGAFVTVEGLNLGRGQIVDVLKTHVCVSWFDTPAHPTAHQAKVLFSAVRPAPLRTQERVYIMDKETAVWQVGRIDEEGEIPGHHFGLDEPVYWVAFPNHIQKRVRRSELRVRWNRPIEDPVALLASQSTETPFWHTGRSHLMQALMNQRASCGGLTGLLSASVELEAHQHRIVHAVLNDPVQRYLLADEVGLGKTIEAGAILRQYMLERPDGRALVVVPSHLHDQWEDELRTRFHLTKLLGNQIRIIRLDDIGSHTSAPDILIVDEAHHPAALAHAPTLCDRQRYAELARIAGQVRCLLLLSATPVLRNEDGFLAMLHLLDPAAYPLEDRDLFRRRVAQRQAIAERLADLADDAAPMFMEEALDGLEEMLADDARLLQLVAAARPLVDEDEEDSRRMTALSDLRTHIGELYRLHRRMLRNRRNTLHDVLLQRAGAKSLEVTEGSGPGIHRALNEWREDALVAVSRHPELQEDARALWWLLLQATLSHPRLLTTMVRHRLREASPIGDRCTLEDRASALLLRPPLFKNEFHRLRDLLLAAEGQPDPRMDALAKYLRKNLSDPLVVFVDRPEVADVLYAHLNSLGLKVRRHRRHEDIAAFLGASGSMALICDSTAEEGINLQRSHAEIFHYDLPLSPNRVEQRIGRVDRYGASKPARSIFFEADEPYTRAWQRCLHEDIQIFSRSVASLQYLLDDQIQLLVRESFELGLDAFSKLRMRLQDPVQGLDKEFDRIRHQENLDALEVDPAVCAQFDAMEEADLEHNTLQAELEAWVVSRLQFERIVEDAYRLRFRYVTKGSRRTLVTVENCLRFFRSSLDSASDHTFITTPLMTWSRNQATRQRLPIIRLGNPLFDGAWEQARHDDRGVAFQMWRYRPICGCTEPLLALRFDFLMDADLNQVEDWLRAHPQLSGPAVRRQLDALLPPAYFTVLLDEHLEPIVDPQIDALLREDYDKGRNGRDINLRPDRWLRVQTSVYQGDWGLLVRQAEVRARQGVADALELRRRCSQAGERFDAEGTRRKAQRLARLQRLEGAAADAERSAMEIESALHERMLCALLHPRIRPDAAGAIVLAASDPFGAERG